MAVDTTPDVPESLPAPLPWLAKSTAQGTPGQTWSRSFDPERLLCVRYTYNFAAYIRCQHTILRRNALRLLGTTLISTSATFVILIGSLGILSAIRPSLTLPPARVIGLLAMSLLILTVLIVGAVILLQAILNPIAGYILKLLRMKQTPFICGVQGLPEVPFLYRPLAWKQVQSIVWDQGDIILIPKNLLRALQYIPREAFPDADAAIRFYTAVTTLHQSGGNPEAIPESSLIEFAP